MWWSYTMHRTMRLCQRKLVYEQKVASPTTKDPARREVFLLRQIQTLPEWQGSLIHHTLANCLVPLLRDRQPFCAEDLIRYAMSLASRQWDFSAKHRFREPGMVKTAQGEEYCALAVHEAEEPSLSKSEALEEVEIFARQCFHHLMAQSDLIARLQRGSVFVAEHQLTFPLSVATVRATPDLVCLLPDNRLLIVDWKTVASETDDYADQLYLYALAASRSERWAGIVPENILLCEVNLLQGSVREYPVMMARLADAEDFVYASIRELATLLAGISKDDFQIEDYEIAEKATTCALCAFRSLCRNDLAQALLQPIPAVLPVPSPRRRSKTGKLKTNVFAPITMVASAPLLIVEGAQK